MRPSVIVGVLLACAVSAFPVQAQVATAPEVKAAFLFNFVKFTTWPESVAPGGAALTICVVGDRRVRVALDDVTRGQRIEGRGIVVLELAEQDDVRRCHLLYASGLGAAREQSLIEATRGTPVLTASDSSTFMKRGGVAAFHIADGRMKFSVNPSAADRAQLRISSRLLALAVIVKDSNEVSTR